MVRHSWRVEHRSDPVHLSLAIACGASYRIPLRRKIDGRYGTPRLLHDNPLSLGLLERLILLALGACGPAIGPLEDWKGRLQPTREGDRSFGTECDEVDSSPTTGSHYVR